MDGVLQSVGFPFEACKRRNRYFYPTFSGLINARDDQFIAFMETVRFDAVSRDAFMICFRFTDINEGFAFAFDSGFVLRATQDYFRAFFDFIINGRFFIFDFMIDVFFFRDFYFSDFRDYADVDLDDFRERCTAFFRHAYSRADRRIIFTSDFDEIANGRFLVSIFCRAILTTSLLASLGAYRMDGIFFTNFTCTIIRAFSRFYRVYDVGIRAAYRVTFRALDLDRASEVER